MSTQTATTLYDYYSSMGQSLPSLSTRADVYSSLGLGTGYTGTAEQNTALLTKLKTLANPATPASAGAITPSTSPAPTTTAPPPVTSAPTAPTAPTAPMQTAGQQLPGLPPISTTPSTGATFAAPTTSSSGSLLDFANALDATTNLAKQKRNASSLALMTPSQGTVAASDFNSILGNLNRASDNTASDLTKRALTAATPTYQTQTIGNDIYQIKYGADGAYQGAEKIGSTGDGSRYGMQTIGGTTYQVQYDTSGKMIAATPLHTDAPKTTEVSPGNTLVDQTGNVIYSAPPKTPTSTTTIKPIGGGAPSTFTSSDKTDVESALRTGTINGTKIGNPIGSDGYIDPAVYVQLMQYWIAQGGTKASFFSNFDYKKYINPDNTWVWAELGVSNPTKSSTSSSSLEEQINSLSL